MGRRRYASGPTTGQLIGLDLNPGMLARARLLPPDGVQWSGAKAMQERSVDQATTLTFHDDSRSPFQRKVPWQCIADPPEDPGSMLAGLTCQERVSINTEEPGLLFTSSFAEGVIRLTDLNL